MSYRHRKSILFISALDFKEKSIQVIRKTPEAYAQHGWEVHYLVARDTSKTGNYFYENEINPSGVFVYRIYWPLTKTINIFRNNRYVYLILSKIRGYLTIFRLAIKATKILKNNAIDVIYGYEMHGVLAVTLLRLMRKTKKALIISRFQGTWDLSNVLQRKDILKILWNMDWIIALKQPSDLLIMTNDGTKGDLVLEKVKSKSLLNYRFWVNGVDLFSSINELSIAINKFCILTVCRLEKGKRIDRGLKVVALLVHKYKVRDITYIIVGDGGERDKLEKMAKTLKINEYVIFVGPVPHNELSAYYNVADAVLLTYDYSNVGNPLLEAIRMNKYIFTLNNGDTNKWIIHKHNGFIYDINDNLLDQMACDMAELITNKDKFKYIEKNLKQTAKEKLWTWQERMNEEINEVSKLLDKTKRFHD